MNEVFFGLKRAHHASLRISRVLLQGEITPARFDLLRLVERHDDEAGVAQSDLARLLGVSGAVVSRMVSSLVHLGLLWRTVDEEDRRRRNVWITPEGSDLVRRLVHDIVAGGADALAIDCALTGGEAHPPRRCDTERARLMRGLNDLRHGFRDGATLETRDWASGSEMGLEAFPGWMYRSGDAGHLRGPPPS
jgi:DNA-binding MarR family transcriptional regulator